MLRIAPLVSIRTALLLSHSLMLPLLPVLLCLLLQQGTDNEQADCVQQAGIWALSVSNNFIGNR